MKQTKVTFKVSPVIERYINKIIDFYDDYEKYSDVGENGIPHVCSIETYLSNEKRYSNSEKNRGDFVKFFEEKGAFEYVPGDDIGYEYVDAIDIPDDEGYPKEFRLRILDIKPIRDFKFKSVDRNTSKVTFDEKTNTLWYGKINHTFQVGKKHINPLPLLIFKKLWNNKRHKDIKGESINPVQLARNLQLIHTDSGYEGVKGGMLTAIRNIGKCLRRKGFPIKIHTKGRIQLELNV